MSILRIWCILCFLCTQMTPSSLSTPHNIRSFISFESHVCKHNLSPYIPSSLTIPLLFLCLYVIDVNLHTIMQHLSLPRLFHSFFYGICIYHLKNDTLTSVNYTCYIFTCSKNWCVTYSFHLQCSRNITKSPIKDYKHRLDTWYFLTRVETSDRDSLFVNWFSSILFHSFCSGRSH